MSLFAHARFIEWAITRLGSTYNDLTLIEIGVQSRNAYSMLSVFRCSFGIRGSELGFDAHGFRLPLPSLTGIVA